MSRIDPMKCYIDNEGVIYPFCMGTAAALGCGKSNSAILSFCTCDRMPKEGSDHRLIKELCERVARLEKEIAELRADVKKIAFDFPV